MAATVDLTTEEPPRPRLVQLSYTEIASGADHSSAIAAAYGYGRSSNLNPNPSAHPNLKPDSSSNENRTPTRWAGHLNGDGRARAARSAQGAAAARRGEHRRGTPLASATPLSCSRHVPTTAAAAAALLHPAALAHPYNPQPQLHPVIAGHWTQATPLRRSPHCPPRRARRTRTARASTPSVGHTARSEQVASDLGLGPEASPALRRPLSRLSVRSRLRLPRADRPASASLGQSAARAAVMLAPGHSGLGFDTGRTARSSSTASRTSPRVASTRTPCTTRPLVRPLA